MGGVKSLTYRVETTKQFENNLKRSTGLYSSLLVIGLNKDNKKCPEPESNQ